MEDGNKEGVIRFRSCAQLKLGSGIRVSSDKQRQLSSKSTSTTMIYDVNSPLFRSFLSQKGSTSDKRKVEDQKPKEQRPKANENKPVMNE